MLAKSAASANPAFSILGQLPPECPPPLDTAWPVDPNPPRELDDELELVEVEPPPLPLRAVGASAVDTELDGRRE